MHPDVKAAWVQALRSGRYTQGRHKLHTRDGYCCLGVLCDLYNPEGWELALKAAFEFGEHYVYCTPDCRAELQLGPEVRAWARLPLGQPAALATMNDNGVTFDEIAAWIDANL